MITGFIAPNGRPGALLSHRHGVLSIESRRAFTVDEQADRVTDKPGESLVLTAEIFEAAKQHAASGLVIIEPAAVEPLTDSERAELVALRQEVGDIFGHLAAIDRALDMSSGTITHASRLAAARAVASERDALRTRVAEAEAALTREKNAHAANVGAAAAKIADLEAQLAAVTAERDALKVAAEKPAKKSADK